MKYHLYFDTAKCSACGACALSCMDQNDIDASCGHQPFRHTYTQEGVHGDLHFFSTACMHCEDAPCVMGCPVGCLYKDEETGFTLYDNTNCIGCHSCAMACPYGVPTFGDDGKMRKCDACIERQKAGLLLCFDGPVTIRPGELPVLMEGSVPVPCRVTQPDARALLLTAQPSAAQGSENDNAWMKKFIQQRQKGV